MTRRRPITLNVVGIPAPQGSKTRMPNGAMVDGGSSKTGRANLAAWRTAVADAARAYLAEFPQPPLAEPLRLSVHFRFAQTKSDPYRWAHTSTPDLDKCVRSTCDALVHGGLLADDRYIFDARVTKHYCGPEESTGASIIVIPAGHDEELAREGRKAEAKVRRAERVAS